MSEENRISRVLSFEEFAEHFDIENIRFGRYKSSGKPIWVATTKNGKQMSGPIAVSLIPQIDTADKVFVEHIDYYLGSKDWHTDDSQWILQARPTDRQLLRAKALRDLYAVLNDKKTEIFGEKAKIITINHLYYQLTKSSDPEAYTEFSIPKKNGKLRTISAPNHQLKYIQQCINAVLQEKYVPTDAAMGFVPGRSVADNAKSHYGRKYVYNVDLKDFFPSISSNRVYRALCALKDKSDNNVFTPEQASILSDLCCHNGVLPQGAPSSPILTNIICRNLDWRLSKLAKYYGVRYTRYADDITFSGDSNIFHDDGDFVNRLKHYVEKEGFTLNPDKSRLNLWGERQEVTGLVVNSKANVKKEYVKNLRTMIHNWENSGHNTAQQMYVDSIKKSNGSSIKVVSDIENVIQGKLNYMKMVKGDSDATYKSLCKRFDTLLQNETGIHDILDCWENDGYDKAVKKYSELCSDTDSGSTDEKFINYLLHSKHVSAEDNQLRQKLISKVYNYLLNLEANLKSGEKNDKKESTKNYKVTNDVPHNPKDTASFLSLFNSPKGFKFLTHDFDPDSNMDYDKLMEQSRLVFKESTFKYKIPKSLYALMRNILYGGETWKDCDGELHNENYATNSWSDWAHDNPKLHLLSNSDFAETIRKFRSSIRLVKPILSDIIERQKGKHPNLSIRTENIEKADFYTYVFYLENGIRRILDDMSSYSYKTPNVLISFERKYDDDFSSRIIRITQIGSESSSLEDVLSRFHSKEGAGAFNEIMKLFNGYANWSVEALWDGKPKRWNILSDINKPEIEELSDINIPGFTHILTYYSK